MLAKKLQIAAAMVAEVVHTNLPREIHCGAISCAKDSPNTVGSSHREDDDRR